ncbi:MAG TPA: HDOD domain-containing protein [Syntrophomonadaceae bacterium]|nr:HDOD domain-containing protein [Syntrophomonadaceae bacterium]
MPRISLESIIEAVNDIPALPHVVVRIMQLTDDPNTTPQDIHSVLNQDQAMTARVLRLANSAYYGYARRIATITDAVVLLGFNTIRSIVMAAAVSELLNKKIEGYALEEGELWRHSQASAITARFLARRCKFAQVDLAYTAGLLHDIGKVILNRYMKDAYHEVVDLVSNQEMPFMQAEEQVLGCNHALIGARVAEKWSLPPQLVEAIQLHHYPDLAQANEKLTAIVHMADAICLSMGIGVGVDGLLYPVSAHAVKILGMSEADIENQVSELADVLADPTAFK